MVSEPLSDQSLVGVSTNVDREKVQVKVAAPKFKKVEVVPKDQEPVLIQHQPWPRKLMSKKHNPMLLPSQGVVPVIYISGNI